MLGEEGDRIVLLQISGVGFIVNQIGNRRSDVIFSLLGCYRFFCEDEIIGDRPVRPNLDCIIIPYAPRYPLFNQIVCWGNVGPGIAWLEEFLCFQRRGIREIASLEHPRGQEIIVHQQTTELLLWKPNPTINFCFC